LAIGDTSPAIVGLACAQLAPTFGDLTGNRSRAAAAIRDAARAGADLIVLPELCTSGYAFADRAEALEYSEPADGPSVSEWRELASEHGAVVVAGFCERDADGAPRNSAAVLDADRSCTIYRKTHLWDREQTIFVAGLQAPPVLDTAAGRIGIAICYDAFFPEVMRGLALAGADLIAVPMNSPAPVPPLPPNAAPMSEIVLALAAATVNRVYVAQADRSGPERGIEWSQASAICDPDGGLIAGPVSGVGLLRATCDLRRARDKVLGERNHVLTDRRTELYATAAANARTPDSQPIKEMVN
jgi:predicted amidohydrolase